eukprot:TRINITY_DN5761_c0_g1_i2.p1 TRINITY_DN5761_c0_g1~~TRINITY_DN5761_c0_g1_i2.p1  ORF type:complete len:2996 (-),score=1114.92 TRINITY_DN5761_c0_g1_i2:153-9140(-)
MKDMIQRIPDTKPGDEFEDLMKSLDDTYEKIVDEAKYQAAVNQDPEQRKNIQDDVSQLEKVMEALKEAYGGDMEKHGIRGADPVKGEGPQTVSVSGVGSGNMKKKVMDFDAPPELDFDDLLFEDQPEDCANEAIEILNSLEQKTNALPLQSLENLQRAADSLVNKLALSASVPEKPISTEKDEKKLKNRVNDLIDAVQNHSDDFEPEQKERVDASLKQLKSDVDDLISKSKTTKNPKVISIIKAEVDKSTNKLSSALQNLPEDDNQSTNKEFSNTSPLREQLREIKESIGAVPAIAQTERGQVDPHLNELTRNMNDLMVNVAAANKSNPLSSKPAVEKSINELENSIYPKYVAASKSLTDNPNDNAKQLAYLDAEDNLVDALDNVEKSINPDITDATSIFIKSVDDLLNKPSNQKDMSALIDDIESAKDFYQEIAAVKSSGLSNEDRENANQIMDKINEAVEKLKNDIAEKKGDDVIFQDAQFIKDLVDDMNDLLHGAALNYLNNVQELSHKLKKLARDGNKPKTDEVTKELAKNVDELIENLKSDEFASVDPQIKEKLDEEALNLKNAINQQLNPAVKGVLEKPNKLEERRALNEVVDSIDNLVDSIDDTISNPTNSGDNFVVLEKDILADDYLSSAAFGDDGTDDSKSSYVDDEYDSPLKRDVSKLKKIGKEMKDAVHKKNLNALSAAAKKGQKEIAEIIEDAKIEAEKSGDPEQIQTVKELEKELTQKLPLILESAKKVLQNPNNLEEKQKFEDITDDFVHALDPIVDRAEFDIDVDDKPVVRNIEKGRKLGKDVKKAVSNKSYGKASLLVAKKGKKELAEILETAKLSIDVDDPSKQEQLDHISENLQNALKKITESSSNDNVSPVELEEGLDEWDNALSDLENLINPEYNDDPYYDDDYYEVTAEPSDKQSLEDELSSLRRQLEQLRSAVAEKNPDKIEKSTAEQDLMDFLDMALREAESMGYIRDAEELSNYGRRRSGFLDTIDEVEEEDAPELFKTVKRFAQNPNDKQAQKKIEDGIQNIVNALDLLESDIRSDVDDTPSQRNLEKLRKVKKHIKEAIKSKNPALLKSAAKKGEKLLAELALINEAQKNDPTIPQNVRSDVSKSTDELAKAYANFIESAKSLSENPNNMRNNEKLQKASGDLDNALENLEKDSMVAQSTSKILSPVDYDMNMLRELGKDVKEKASNPKRTKSIGEVSNSINQIRPQGAKLSGTIQDVLSGVPSSDSDKVALKNEVDNLNKNVIPKLESSYKQVSDDPTNQQKVDALLHDIKEYDSSLDKIQKGLDNYSGSMAFPDDESPVSHEVKVIQNILKDINKASETKDNQTLLNTLGSVGAKELSNLDQSLVNKLNDSPDDENLQNMVKSLSELRKTKYPNLVSTAKMYSKNPTTSLKRALDDATDDCSNELDNLKLLNNSSSELNSENETPVHRDLSKLKNIGKNIKANAIKKNKAAIKTNAKTGEKFFQDFKDDINKHAEGLTDPAMKMKFLEQANEILISYPLLIDIANRLADDPDNPEIQKAFQVALEKFTDAADMLKATELDEKPLKRDIKNIRKVAQKIKSAASSKKPEALNQAKLGEKELAQFVDDVLAAATEVAVNNPEDEEKLIKSCAVLEKLYPKIVALAKQAALDPNSSTNALDQNLETFNTALDTIDKILNAPTAESNESSTPVNRSLAKLKVIGNKIKSVASQKNPERVLTWAKLGEKCLVEYIEEAKKAANAESDPSKREEILSQIQPVQDALMKLILDAVNASKSPENAALEKSFQDSSDNFDDIINAVTQSDSNNAAKLVVPDESPLERDIDRLQKLGSKLKVAVKDKNPSLAAMAAKQGQKELAEVIEKAKELAEQTSDPNRKQDINDSIKEVERTYPLLVKETLSNLKNPNESKVALEEASKQLASALSSLENMTQSNYLDDNSKLMSKRLDMLLNAKEKRNRTTEVGMMKQVRLISNKMIQQGDYEAQETGNVKNKKQIYNAVEAMRSAIQSLDDSVTRNKNEAEIKDLIGKLTDVSKNLLEATNAECISDLKRVEVLNDDISNAAENGNYNLLQNQSLKLGPSIEDVVKTSSVAMSKETDPNRKKLMQATLAQLEDNHKVALRQVNYALENPNDPDNKVNLKVATSNLKQDVSNLQNLLRHKNIINSGQKQLTKGADSVQHLLPSLNKAKQGVLQHPNDPRAQRQLINVAAQLNKKAQQLPSVVSQPNEQVVLKKFQLQQNIKQLTDSVENKKPNLQSSSIKSLEENVNQFSHQLRKTNMSPETSQQVDTLLKKIDKIVPTLVNTAKESIKSPDNQEKKNELRQQAHALSRTLDRVSNKVAPKQDEKVIRDSSEALRKKIQEIKAANQIKNQQQSNNSNNSNKLTPQSQGNSTSLHQNQQSLNRALQRVAHTQPVKDSEPFNELQNAWKKFGIGSRQLSTVNPTELDAISKEVEKKLEKVDSTLNATQIASVQDVEDAIEDVLDAVEDNFTENKEEKLSQTTNNLANQAKNLSNQVNSIKDPKIKEKALKSLNQLNSSIKQSVDCLGKQNSNKEIEKELMNSKVLLSQIKADIDQDKPNRLVELQARKAELSVNELRGAASKQDVTKVKSIVQNLKDQINEVSSSASSSIPKSQSTSSKQKQLNQVVSTLDKKIKELEKPENQNDKVRVESLCLDTTDALEEIVDIVKSDAIDNLMSTSAKVTQDLNVLLNNNGELTAPEIMEKTKELSENLHQLVSSARDSSNEIDKDVDITTKSPAPKDNTPVSSLVNSIKKSTPNNSKQQTSSPSSSTPSLNVMISSLNSLANPTQPSRSFVRKPAESKTTTSDINNNTTNKTPTTKSNTTSTQPSTPSQVTNKSPSIKSPSSSKFEDVVSHVAESIAAQEAALNLSEAHEITKHLNEIATAANKGNKPLMISESKALGEAIKRFNARLREIANKIPKSPKTMSFQDQLIRAAQSLENNNTQLRILISVKAASSSSDKETESTLASLLHSVGNSVNNGLRTIEFLKKTKIL